MQVSEHVLSILDRCVLEGNALRLPQQLNRDDYLAVNKVIECAGGRWTSKAGAHLFERDATTAIEPILLTGEVTDAKREFGMFETTEHVAERVIEIARIQPGDLVLEPQAGRGALAVPVARLGAVVACIEIQPVNCEHLTKQALAEVRCADFLSIEPRPTYDKGVMNPPFASQDDIRHVMHAAKFLRDGGRLVSVMSAGVTFRENRLTRDFREFVDEREGEIERLPEGAFKASGTGVNAVIVSFDQ